MVSITISVLSQVLVRNQDIGNTVSHSIAGGKAIRSRRGLSVGTVAHHDFRKRAAMRDSAEAQPASKGWPGLSRSMSTGA